jgi:hypothetical protein
MVWGEVSRVGLRWKCPDIWLQRFAAFKCKCTTVHTLYVNSCICCSYVLYLKAGRLRDMLLLVDPYSNAIATGLHLRLTLLASTLWSTTNGPPWLRLKYWWRFNSSQHVLLFRYTKTYGLVSRPLPGPQATVGSPTTRQQAPIAMLSGLRHSWKGVFGEATSVVGSGDFQCPLWLVGES